MNEDTPRLHPDAGDIDFHRIDADQARCNGTLYYSNSPWCQCPYRADTLFICPACGRFYGPLADAEVKFTIAP
jgi:hypothetical protein